MSVLLAVAAADGGVTGVSTWAKTGTRRLTKVFIPDSDSWFACSPRTHHHHHRYNKYTSICARATRQCLKEADRVKAERRGEMALRYQEWKEGKASDSVSILVLVLRLRLRGWNSLL